MYILLPALRIRISLWAIPSYIILLWCEGLTPFLILIFSALLHELGHISALLLQGLKPRRIDILPMGALIACPEGIPPKRQLAVALAGPAVSLLLGAVSALLFAIFGGVQLAFTAAVNIVLGTFNLLPMQKNDGGKALRQLLWLCNVNEKKARRIGLALSAVSKLLFCGCVGVCLWSTNFNLGAFLLSVALILQL